MTYLFQITAPHFTAGGELGWLGGELQVIRYAPIIAYMRRWTPHQIKNYCDKKGWQVARVDRMPD